MAPGTRWGTISPCYFPLGHQRMTNFEIQQSVERLSIHRPRQVKQWWPDEWSHNKATRAQIKTTLSRLTKNASEKVTDSKRVAQGRIYRMGVVNSYAWKGYN